MCSRQGLEGFTKCERVCRKFILTEDQSQVRNFVADLKQFVDGNTVNVSEVLRYLGEKGTTLANYQFQFVDQHISVRPLEQQIHLGIQEFTDHVITINRKPIKYAFCDCLMQETKQPDMNQRSEMMDSNTIGEKNKIKKHKQKQRKIKSAIECVKVWRGIFQQSGHKISLLQVAKSMGISKKSLDDYFLQIRLGQLYGFDFIRNINRGIGVLRSYIRQKTNKQLQKKVPKIIKSFDLVRDYEQLKQIMLLPESLDGTISGDEPKNGMQFRL